MKFESLICPQCGGNLPRQALWRTVNCPFCHALVTKCEEMVRAEDFRQAYLRAHALEKLDPLRGPTLQCRGQRYQILQHLASGNQAEVYLAQRCGPQPMRVVLKIARSNSTPDCLKREAAVLQQLQAINTPAASYFSTRLPQLVAQGRTEFEGRTSEILVLRHPAGYWGSLAQTHENYPQGLDARHIVWMWRRSLEMLAFLHAAGWCHGQIACEHLLVNAPNHGILLIGWSAAQANCSSAAQLRDLQQLAWAMRQLLSPASLSPPALPPQLPSALSKILLAASEDQAWCASHGALGLDQAVKMAAREAFGAPRFIPFYPVPRT